MPLNLLRKPSFAWYDVKEFFRVPPYPGARLTLKRRLNLYLVKLQRMKGHTRLWGYPTVLTIEAANVCNLRCPYCFTGAGEVGRKGAHFPVSLYKRLIDELGDYLFEVELHNWGEPLLNKDIAELVRIASGRGISTTLSTNFSFPFDASRAEALVSAGLSQLGVSIDGVTQETYEQYRVRGKLDTVLDNVHRIIEAKRKLASSKPRLIWEFHVFEHNKDDVETAKSMARELGMDIDVSKGWVAGPEWQSERPVEFFMAPTMDRCGFLWQRAVVNGDGGVSPCCGAFYEEDDFGSVSGRSFKEVWNNETFQEARRLFRSRQGPESGGDLICRECPETLNWQDYLRHLAEGRDRFAFKSRFTTNDGFNFFFNRRPPGKYAPGASDVVELRPVDAKPAVPPGKPR